MRFKLLPYKGYSSSGKALARQMNILRISTPNRPQKLREWVINWGTGSPTQRLIMHQLWNRPERVKVAANKLLTFRVLENAGIAIPAYTNDRTVAQQWQQERSKVVCRSILCGHSGQGITVVKRREELPIVPLYTRYIPRDAEYRVHVAFGKVIDYARKKKRHGYADAEDFNRYVRTAATGWVFCRDNVVLPQQVQELAVQAVYALGLDFGAVDLAWVEEGQRAVVFEVNTAPGLEGTTLTKYAEAFKSKMVQIAIDKMRRR